MAKTDDAKPDTIESQIDRLIVQADALRSFSDDDPKKTALAGIVDQINALRAIQEGAPTPDERIRRAALKNAQIEAA
jgi:hypothetical protein